MPLMWSCWFLWQLQDKLVRHIPFVGSATDFLFPAKPIRLETLALYAERAIRDELTEEVISNRTMERGEGLRKQD